MGNPGKWISVPANWFWSYSPGLVTGIKILVKRLCYKFCGKFYVFGAVYSDGSSISQTGGGAPTSEIEAKTYYLSRFLSKTAWKWKKLDRGRVPSAPLDPPMVYDLRKTLRWPDTAVL